MNKQEATNLFKTLHSDILRKKNPGTIRLFWNNHVDHLQKSGNITEHQAHIWVNPFVSKKDR